MRLKSIRARVLYLAAVFAVLLVGSVTLVTYFVVAESMTDASSMACARLASSVSDAAGRAVTKAVLSVRGVASPEAASADARRVALEQMPEVLSGPVRAVDGARAALWLRETPGGDLRLLWESDPGKQMPDWDGGRRALAQRNMVLGQAGRAGILVGFLRKADLGTFLAAVPVDLPGDAAGVVEIAYDPVREERVLDGARQPMIAVGAIALALAILMMQIVMGWVLSLVEEIRRAADSIDAGQLDVRLPETGEHEISDLARSLNALIDRLKKRADAQTRFVADASHELATPVAGIRGYVNILRAWGAGDPEMRDEAIAAIDRESRRMAKLCADLLAMIRSEELLEFKNVRYDVNAVAREVLANAATRYMDKNLEFSGPDEGPLTLWGDPDRIEEALGILVDNACKYTPAGGRVEVSTRRHKDRVIIEVSDTGIGIPEEDLPNIFERFYRSDASRSKETGGFGLGLSIAKHIVDTSGGMIWARSKLGSGTTFIISLPRNKQKGPGE
ncbi:MAG: HAMP domain-containing histidine kinase [Coriobacteriia bacterium]|nr:HAMP domain-containing histidine kinase [Coriobacteriia bacterium]